MVNISIFVFEIGIQCEVNSVESGHNLTIGAGIVVRQTVNKAWLVDMSDMTQHGWSTNRYSSIRWRRTITNITGDLITIDAPIVQPIDEVYGGGEVFGKYCYMTLIKRVSR